MNAYRRNYETNEPDELIIPSKNGFIVIPTNSIRVQEPSRQGVKRESGRWRSDPFMNVLQFVLMLVAMVTLLGYVGYAVAGFVGLVAIGATGSIGFLVAYNTGIDRLLKSPHIREIGDSNGYRLYRMLEELAEKAGLEKMPRLFLDQRPSINAYTLEDKQRAAIVLSEDLLYNLSPREIKGVLAHEIAHLRNRDIGIMVFSDQVRRLTGYMAIAGQLLLLIYLPLMLINGVSVPWAALLVMIAAPTLSSLIQVALSRNREFKADMDAADISEDAAGLASALRKINAHTSFWQKLYAPYLREIPELLRTHPDTAARIERLKQIHKNRDYNIAWETI